MLTESVFQSIVTWVSQYIAIFCLFTVLVWGGGCYLYMDLDRWKKPVRDAVTYFVILGTLTLTLMTQNVKVDPQSWSAFSWFCFAMLVMFELLWLASLTESLLNAIYALRERNMQRNMQRSTGQFPYREIPRR